LAPVQLALLVQDPQEGEPYLLLYSLLSPLLGGGGSERNAKPPGEVSPPGAEVQDPENTIERALLVSPRAAPLFGWGQ
jgi:hypothetical protein